MKERAYIIGFMKTQDAIKYSENLNKNSDKVAMIIYIISDKSFENNKTGYDIQLTTTNNKVNTHMPSVMPVSQFNNEKKWAKIYKNEDVQIVFTFDPKWGRKATSKYGLYNDVIKSL